MVSTYLDCGTSLRIFPIVNVIRLSGIPSFAKNFLARSITSGKSNRTPLTWLHPGNLSMRDKSWPFPPLMSMIRIHLPQGYKVKTLGCELSSSSSKLGQNHLRIRSFFAVNPLFVWDSPLLLFHDHTLGCQFCTCSRDAKEKPTHCSSKLRRYHNKQPCVRNSVLCLSLATAWPY